MIKLRKLIWASHVARTAVKSNAYRILMGKPAGIRQLGRPRRKWVDNIKTDLGKIGWGGMSWIETSGGLLLRR
jgi:hypothetical protein